MAEMYPPCTARNPRASGYGRAGGHILNHSAGRAEFSGMTDSDQDRSRAPWIATALIAALLLCCLSMVGVMLLDQVMPSRPFQTLLLGSPTSTATQPPQATLAPNSTPTPALSTPRPALDPFEPDDTMAQASPLGTGGDRQAHTLSPSRDRDYVSFPVEAGVRYTVETGGLGFQCDTVLTLYDEDGLELVQDDDSGAENLASRLSWTAREEGVLFAEVRQFNEDVELEDVGYEIWVSESEPLVLEEDEYEPDDAQELANEILVGSSQVHTIHRPDDRDWVFFEVQAGQTYVVETSGLQGGMDTIIFLHDGEGRTLAENDDSGAEELASRITWLARSSGTLFVAIQGYSGEEVTPEMGYTISVTPGAPYEPDVYEPDDTLEEAGVIEVGSQQQHSLHVTGDRDWLSFQAEAGTAYVLQTFHLGESIDTTISLYDAQGTLLASDDDLGSEPLASRLDYEPEQDGPLYVLVQDLGDRYAGPGTEYSISVHEQGSALSIGDRYEPDNGMDQATRIEIGEVQTHDIHAPGDVDWLSFQAEPEATYVIETYNLGEEMDTVLFLYDEGGQELAQDDDDGDEPFASRLTWTAGQTGTLYLSARHYKDDKAGPRMSYDVSILEAGEGTAGALPGVYIADGAYHIVTLETGQLVVGVSESLLLSDFTLEVDAAQVSGDNDNEYGLVCGYQDDDNYHELAISGDGYVGFFARERGRWETISAFESHEGINQGNAVNHLRLEVAAGVFSFYVNGQPALRESDTRLGHGLIGFGCGSFGEPGLHCLFDNLKIWGEDGRLVWEDNFDDNSANWHERPAP